MSGHSVSAAHEKIIRPLAGLRVRQPKRAPPACAGGNRGERI